MPNVLVERVMRALLKQGFDEQDSADLAKVIKTDAVNRPDWALCERNHDE